MKFCNVCDNMYYISINEKNKNELTYYCRNCKNTSDVDQADNTCVLSTNFKNNDDGYNHIINTYTKHDPTLPHIYNIPCPNDQCDCNTKDDVKNDIIYLRYDDKKMKYIYLCTLCDITWKTNSKN